MQYYTLEISEESKTLCTILTPFRKYMYTPCLWVKKIPAIAQAAIENDLSYIDAADLYINAVRAFFSSWDHHMHLLGFLFA